MPNPGRMAKSLHLLGVGSQAPPLGHPQKMHWGLSPLLPSRPARFPQQVASGPPPCLWLSRANPSHSHQRERFKSPTSSTSTLQPPIWNQLSLLSRAVRILLSHANLLHACCAPARTTALQTRSTQAWCFPPRRHARTVPSAWKALAGSCSPFIRVVNVFTELLPSARNIRTGQNAPASQSTCDNQPPTPPVYLCGCPAHSVSYPGVGVGIPESPFRAQPGKDPDLSSESPVLSLGLKPGNAPKRGVSPHCRILGNGSVLERFKE